MARKKVKLEWIANDAARRATFKKRRKGLMKKVSELSTLCDVEACLIVYGPNEKIPEVWPSGPDAVGVLARQKKMSQMDQCKKMMNQEGFMRQRIAKMQDQLRKQDRENRELETTLLMYESLMERKSLDTVGIEEVTSLAWLVEMKVNEVLKRIEGWRGNESQGEGGGIGSSKNIDKGKKKAHAPAHHEEVAKEEERMMMKVKEEGEEEEKKSPMEMAMEELQRQEWFAEIMNHQPPPPPPPHTNNHHHHQHHHMIWGDQPLGFPPAFNLDHTATTGTSTITGTNTTSMMLNNGTNHWLDAYFPLD